MRVAVARSSRRTFSSGAWARQSSRAVPSEVVGTRAAAQTWYIGVPGIESHGDRRWPCYHLGRRPGDAWTSGDGPTASTSARSGLEGRPRCRRSRARRGCVVSRHDDLGLLIGDQADVEARMPLGRHDRLGLGSRWPGPRPWMLRVGSNVMPEGLAPVEPADEGSTPSTARAAGRRSRGVRVDDRQLGPRRWPRTGVEPRGTAGRPPRPTSRRAPGSAGPQHWVAASRRWSGRRRRSCAPPAPRRRCPARRRRLGRSVRSRPPPSMSAASASRDPGHAGRAARRGPAAGLLSPSTRKRTRHGSRPTAASHASMAQTRGRNSPLLSVAPRA